MGEVVVLEKSTEVMALMGHTCGSSYHRHTAPAGLIARNDKENTTSSAVVKLYWSQKNNEKNEISNKYRLLFFFSVVYLANCISSSNNLFYD